MGCQICTWCGRSYDQSGPCPHCHNQIRTSSNIADYQDFDGEGLLQTDPKYPEDFNLEEYD